MAFYDVVFFALFFIVPYSQGIRSIHSFYVEYNICRHKVSFPISCRKFSLYSFSWDQTIRTYLDVPEDQS